MINSSVRLHSADGVSHVVEKWPKLPNIKYLLLVAIHCDVTGSQACKLRGCIGRVSFRFHVVQLTELSALQLLGKAEGT